MGVEVLILSCFTASTNPFKLYSSTACEIKRGLLKIKNIPATSSTIIAILGNMEKIALFFFIPYILETVLKLRGRLKKYSFAKVREDGDLEVPYKKFYGLEHIAIYLLKKMKSGGKVHEKEVVYLIYGFQLIIILLGFLLFL